MNLVIAFAHSHSWFQTQTLVSSIRQHGMDTTRIVIVDNSWDSSPSIRGIAETALEPHVFVVNNRRAIRSHGGALDLVVEKFKPDFLLTMEPDVTVCRDGWLQAFMDMLRPTDFVVGAWHHVEQFVNPSVALYRGSVLQDALVRSLAWDTPYMHWGPNFSKATAMPAEWIPDKRGPFGDNRGFPEGTRFRTLHQDQGPGWYEPGQCLFYWAVDNGHTYSVMPSMTDHGGHDGTIPIGTYYGDPKESPWCVHWWAGTRALTTMFLTDTHQDWYDPCLVQNRDYWLRREAKLWLETVPADIQRQTLELIRKHGWRLGDVAVCNRKAIAEIEAIYREAGIPL